MNEYLVRYREQGQMGWDKKKYATVKADNKEEAENKFRTWASKPSQYTRTMLAIYMRV